MAHGLAPSFWLRIESIRSGAVGRCRIDLRDGVILRVRWPLRQTGARCPRVALPLVRDADPEVRPCPRTARPWPTSPPRRTSRCRPPRSRSPARDRSPPRRVSGCWTPPPRSTTPVPTRSAASCAAAGPGSSASSSATRCAARSATPSSIQVLDGLVSTLGPLDLGVLLIPGSSDPSGPAVDPLLETAAMDVAVHHVGRHHRRPDARRAASPRDPDGARRGAARAGRGLGRHRRPRRHAPGAPSTSSTLGHTRIADGDAAVRPAAAARASSTPTAWTHLDWEITRRRLAGRDRRGRRPRSRSTRRRRRWSSTAAPPGLALLSGADRPTAIACQSDLLASGRRARARVSSGCACREDVSVSGFDGLDLPWLAPDVLTTVVQPLAEKGAAVGHAVEDLLAGEPDRRRASCPVDAADRHDDRAGARTGGGQPRGGPTRLGLAQHPGAVDGAP